MQFFRPALGEGVASSRHLRAMAGGERVTVAGLVVCRQRPLTARGIVFLLLEDEFGMVNVLVSEDLVERQRDEVYTATFLVAHGLLDPDGTEQRTLVAKRLDAFHPVAGLRTPEGKSWA